MDTIKHSDQHNIVTVPEGEKRKQFILAKKIQ